MTRNKQKDEMDAQAEQEIATQRDLRPSQKTNQKPSVEKRAILFANDQKQRQQLLQMLQQAEYEVSVASHTKEIETQNPNDIVVFGQNNLWKDPFSRSKTPAVTPIAKEILKSLSQSFQDKIQKLTNQADDWALRLGIDPFFVSLRTQFFQALSAQKLEEDLRRKNRALEHLTAELRRANAELLRLSVTDSLTEMNNRRHFMEALRREFQRAQRYRHPLSLLLIDIDHFKQVNDTYGHPVGDAVLVGFAKQIKRSIRRTDLCARLGGEEFAIAFIEANMTEAKKASELLREEIAKEIFSYHDTQVSITISGGLVEATHAKTEDHLSLIEIADRALYEAKTGGRNRIVTFTNDRNA